MANVAWGDYDKKSMKYYYTESYSMSTTDFAEEVNTILNTSCLVAGDMIAYSKKSQIPEDSIHIPPRKKQM